MKVVSIQADKGYTSKNGKTYHNYYLQTIIEKEINGQVCNLLQRFTLTDSAIRPLIEGNKIRSIEDLIGHEVKLYRSFPVYFDKIEKDYMLPNGQMKADMLVVVK